MTAPIQSMHGQTTSLTQSLSHNSMQLRGDADDHEGHRYCRLAKDNLDSIECDFVIIKGTQGTNYVNTFCDAFVQKAIKAGKLWGFYHFMNMDDPVKQAITSIRTVKLFR